MFSASYILQQFINAILLGSMYALVAIGLSMVYGILRLINFAHGDILMLSAYMGLFFLVSIKAPFIIVLIVPMVLGGIIGIVVERIAYRPLRKAPDNFTCSFYVYRKFGNYGAFSKTQKIYDTFFSFKTSFYRCYKF